MAPIGMRVEGLLAKKEVTYGTDPVPTTANGVKMAQRIFAPTLTIDDAFLGQRKEVVTGGIITAPPVAPVGAECDLDLLWELKGMGAASTAPEADPLFQAAGCSSVVTAGSAVYTQVDSGHASATVYAYAGGKLFKIVGCRGVISWGLKTGGLDVMRFKMKGMVTGYADTALLAGITYSTVNPLLNAGIALTVGSYAPDAVEFDFDQGATLRRLESMSQGIVPGIAAFDYAQSTPTARMVARVVPAATYDPYGDSGLTTQVRTVRALSLTLGTVTFNKVALTAGAWVYAPKHKDLEDFAAWELMYDLDNTWTFTFS